MPSLSPTDSLPSEPSRSAASSPAPSPAVVSRTDVLLIDDSVADLRLLMELMTLRDLRLSVALDGERGYQQALLLRPGLILVGMHMPGSDGFAPVVPDARVHRADPGTYGLGRSWDAYQVLPKWPKLSLWGKAHWVVDHRPGRTA